jgi:splicing factor 3A subunit 3
MELEFGASNPDEEEAELEAKFTGEEAFGKYLDLHAQHEQFVNLAPAKKDEDDGDGRRTTYLEYLSDFDKFDGIPKATKAKAAYEKRVFILLVCVKLRLS